MSNGTCAIDANQAGDTNYNAAQQVTQSFSIGKTAQTITFPAIADFSWSGGSATLGATASSGLAVSYSVTSGPCSVTGSHADGDPCRQLHRSPPDQAGNDTYKAAPQQTRTATVTKADQTINVTQHAPGSAVFGTGFTVAATGGGSSSPVTFSNGGVCSNSGATFTMTSGTGTCSVKYDQAGDSDYNAAPQVVESVTAQKANQTITVNQHAPSSAKFNSSFGVAGRARPAASSTLHERAGPARTPANSSRSRAAPAPARPCTTRAETANYNAAPQVTESVTAQKADQTITVGTHAPPSAAYNSQFTVAATGGGSSSPVTFSNGGSCSNSGATFTMTSGTGTCTVKYDQAGDANYNAATQVTENVTATKAGQTINVTQHAPASAVFNTQFTVAATGGASGNAVTFSSANGCSNSGATFTMTSGTTACSVRYDQAGDSNYAAATQVVENVTAQKASQTITVTTHAPGSKAYGASFGVAGNAPGGVVTFTSGGNCSNSGTSSR